MKLIIFILLALSVGCAESKKTAETSPPQEVWTLSEPQIVNNKGKIFLTNVQHQSKEPLKLTDSLLFDQKNVSLDLTFSTLTRCYDSKQKELSEEKQFKFSTKITIQKLMPEESLHPNYHMRNEVLNCTFKFKVKRADGSSHDFRLYSQSVSLMKEGYEAKINILGSSPDQLYIMTSEELYKEYFILPSLDIEDITLVCQSFKLDYLSQIQLMSPFIGFNLKSIETKPYPRELCHIVAKSKNNLILSNLFQIQFSTLNLPYKFIINNNQYSETSKDYNFVDIQFSNPNYFSVSYNLTLPKDIMINKHGMNYTQPLKIEFKDKKIKPLGSNMFKVHLKAHESFRLYLYANISRTCVIYHRSGSLTYNTRDISTDFYFQENQIVLSSRDHNNFIYNHVFKNNNKIAFQIPRNITYINPYTMSSLTRRNDKKPQLINNYIPKKNNKCRTH